MTGRLNKVVAQCVCIVLTSTLLVHAEPSVYGFGSDENTNNTQIPVSSKGTPELMVSPIELIRV